jgi:hypothetical protein
MFKRFVFRYRFLILLSLKRFFFYFYFLKKFSFFFRKRFFSFFGLFGCSSEFILIKKILQIVKSIKFNNDRFKFLSWRISQLGKMQHQNFEEINNYRFFCRLLVLKNRRLIRRVLFYFSFFSYKFFKYFNFFNYRGRRDKKSRKFNLRVLIFSIFRFLFLSERSKRYRLVLLKFFRRMFPFIFFFKVFLRDKFVLFFLFFLLSF